MSYSTTAQVRQALADAISAGVTGWQVSPYMLALPMPPAIDVRPAGTTFHTAMGDGKHDPAYVVRAMCAWNADRASQVNLDTLLDLGSATSMLAILEADRTLGGTVQDLTVTDVSDYKALIVEGQPSLIAVDFRVEIIP